MEDTFVPAAPLDAGATVNIECQRGTCLFGGSSLPSDSDVNEALPAAPSVIEEEFEVNSEAEELNADEGYGVWDGTSVSEESEDPQSDEEEEAGILLPCKETDANCPFAECDVHKEQCDVCHKHCLVPGDSEERRIHTAVCAQAHIEKSELQQSYDKICNICMEVVMEKRPREQRFGILPNCRHAFCLKCIRTWRKTDNTTGRVRRSCPVCRKVSKFVCPSFVWVEDYQPKIKLITAYKKGCKQTKCKYLQLDNRCPFGKRCFYRHADT